MIFIRTPYVESVKFKYNKKIQSDLGWTALHICIIVKTVFQG